MVYKKMAQLSAKCVLKKTHIKTSLKDLSIDLNNNGQHGLLSSKYYES